MKKFFSLAVALIAMAGVASAQDYITVIEDNRMVIEGPDGSTTEIKDPVRVTFGERPDVNEGWTSLGKGLYTEDFMYYMYNLSPYEMEVEIQVKDDEPGVYRLVNPYANYPWTIYGSYDYDESYFIVIDASDPDAVYIKESEIGLGFGYGIISVWSMAGYYMEHGYTLQEVKYLGYCGTLVEGVISGFPEFTLLASEPNYEGGAWYMLGTGEFRVVLPDAVAGAPTRTPDSAGIGAVPKPMERKRAVVAVE